MPVGKRILLTEEQKKANKKASDKKWREENKEQIKKQKKTFAKKYYEENKEQIKENSKEYRQTEKGKRSGKVNNWKQYGMIEPEGGWEAFVIMVENTTNCELCNVELTTDKVRTKTTRCVDHSHITNLFRNVVCNSCNISLPRGT